MRRILTIVLLLGLAGCGSDISGGVTIADAREECNAFQIMATGQSLSEGLFDAIIISAEASRDAGQSKNCYINQTSDACVTPSGGDSQASKEQCLVCFTAIAAVVWP